MTEQTTPELTTAERIADGVIKYRHIKANPSALETLLKYKRVFSTLLFEFSVEVGRLYEQKNETEFQRKAAFERGKKERKGEKVSMTQAENETLVEIEELIRRESIADSEYKRGALMLQHAENVFNSMVQDISHLKAEKRAETYGGGSQST